MRRPTLDIREAIRIIRLIRISRVAAVEGVVGTIQEQRRSIIDAARDKIRSNARNESLSRRPPSTLALPPFFKSQISLQGISSYYTTIARKKTYRQSIMLYSTIFYALFATNTLYGILTLYSTYSLSIRSVYVSKVSANYLRFKLILKPPLIKEADLLLGPKAYANYFLFFFIAYKNPRSLTIACCQVRLLRNKSELIDILRNATLYTLYIVCLPSD